MKKIKIEYGKVSKYIIVTNVAVTTIYLLWWLRPTNAGNWILYLLLFAGEIYHMFMSLTFWFTVWPGKQKEKLRINNENYEPFIDVFITVAGEPAEVVAQTAAAARDMDYPQHKVYILNDGRVANKENWQEIEQLAKNLGVACITRTVPGGAKAGNVNNGLAKTKGQLVAIFDADMVPHKDFLKKTVDYFQDEKVGFVQTPQYYSNFETNIVTAGSWDQQKFFFGPILRGKEKSNAAFICGTNVLIRRKALMEVGGLVENNIAEDFLTSLFIHQKGWVSHYLPTVLAQGMAPMDLLSFYKQQFRWARGSLEVLFGYNPLLRKDLTWGQKIQYLSSALYYFNGLVVLIDIMMPLFFLFTGIQPVTRSTASFAVYFLPFILLNLYTLNLASGASISFKTFSFSYALWHLQIMALISVLLKKNVKFSVTPKQAQSGNYIGLATPHLLYIVLVLIGCLVAIVREQFDSAVATNMAWAMFNIALFMPYVLVAINQYPVPIPVIDKDIVLVKVE